MLYDVIKHNVMTNVAPWCSGYHYYTTSFIKGPGSNSTCGESEIRDGEDL